jgi:hypothetical protein
MRDPLEAQSPVVGQQALSGVALLTASSASSLDEWAHSYVLADPKNWGA